MLLTIVLVLIVVADGKIANAYISDENYDLMPKVFHLDDFDECFSRKKSLYCRVSIQLEPSPTAKSLEIWDIIKNASSYKNNYKHDLLRYGVCVPKSCPDIDDDLNENDQNLLDGISFCYSQKFENLGLKAKVTEISCQNTKNAKHDFIDVFVTSLLVLYFIFVAIVSLLHLIKKPVQTCLRLLEKNANVFVLNSRFLENFSLWKNWNSLMTIQKSDETLGLELMSGARFAVMFFVILEHAGMGLFSIPNSNTRYTEKMNFNPINTLISNNYSYVELFFVFSGWLLCYNFFRNFEKEKHVTFATLAKLFLKRYVRITLPLMFVIAFHATSLIHLGNGPVWDQIIGTDRRYCRKNWWTNLLYINDYYDYEKMCLHPTWYLSADTKLYAIGLLVVWLMFKHKRAIPAILLGFFALGCTLHATSHYFYKNPITMLIFPEDMLTYLRHNVYNTTVYNAGFTHLSSFVIGIGFGYIYYKYHGRLQFAKKKVYMYFCMFYFWFVIHALIMVQFFYHKEDFACSQIWATIYDVTVRNVFAFGLANFILYLTENAGNIRRFLELPTIRILGRLSFSAFLVHLCVIDYRIGILKSPPYLSDAYIYPSVLMNTVLSYVAALVFSLFVENPIVCVLKSVFLTKNDEKADAEKTE